MRLVIIEGLITDAMFGGLTQFLQLKLEGFPLLVCIGLGFWEFQFTNY
jgi:hypothetical protein